MVDMDRVEAANIGRHPIFTQEDTGKFKAHVMAQKNEFVVAHNQRIEEMLISFFRHFHLIICAVDSISTRRWLNYALFECEQECLFIESGCEGKVAHARIFETIKRGKGPCVECTLDLYAKDETLPLCGLPSEFGSVEMCVQWASAMNPTFDMDKTVELARDKAAQLGFNSHLVDREFCDSVLNRTVPTDPETNAEIAKLALDYLSKEPFGAHTFINVCDGHVQKHNLLPSESECMICW